jgi:hypothetical protein
MEMHIVNKKIVGGEVKETKELVSQFEKTINDQG